MRSLWLLVVCLLLAMPPAAHAQAADAACGLRVPGVKLKDHSLFSYAGAYYLLSIRIDLPEPPDGRGERSFVLARSSDLCTWQVLGDALTAAAPDEAYLWAPHVLQFGETWHMYYTSVDSGIAQTIRLATASDPAALDGWTRQPMLFQPDHPSAVYPGAGAWSDARDPMVLPYAGRYLLYYTGRDTSGGIIGVADSRSPAGAWRDLGAVLRAEAGVVPESPFVLAHGDYYYLIYNASGANEQRWHWSISPFGPWQAGGTLAYGWAHDFWQSEEGWLVSYVVGNGAAIRVERLGWVAGDPPAPQIGSRVLLPLVVGE